MDFLRLCVGSLSQQWPSCTIKPYYVILFSGAFSLIGRKALLSLYRRWLWYPFPGPRGGILGLQRDSDPTRSAAWFENLYRAHCNYGGSEIAPVSIRILGQVVVLIADKDDIKHVLDSRPDRISRSRIVRALFDVNFEQPGLFTAEGQEWRCQRRIYAPAFSKKNAQMMLPIIAEKAASLADRLSKLQTVENGVTWFKHCTTDIVLQAAFGLEFDYLKGGNDRGDAIMRDMVEHLKDARCTSSAPHFSFPARPSPRFFRGEHW